VRIPLPRPVRRVPLILLGLAGCAAPSGERAAAALAADPVVVFAAASLSGPLRAVRDTFARIHPAGTTEEHGGSLELARRATELERVPDVLALADQEVFTELLVPRTTRWFARFARNRLVIAYTDRSRHANAITASTWWRIILRDDVLAGRADPALAPAGYRTLLMYELAERYYRQPGLAARLAGRSPARLQRGNAAELAALLEAGELDYIVEYESLARSHGFRWVTLPPEIDLGDAAREAEYATVSVRVRRGHDSVSIAGAAILYGVSVPRAAPHPDAGARFVALLLSPEGRALLRRAAVDALDRPARRAARPGWR
jgi:molybdate/tungstate transport system substrate-binding protein